MSRRNDPRSRHSKNTNHTGHRNPVLTNLTNSPTVPIWKWDPQCRDRRASRDIGEVQCTWGIEILCLVILAMSRQTGEVRDSEKVQSTRGIEIPCLVILATVPQSQFGRRIRNVATDDPSSRHWKSKMHTGHRNSVLTNYFQLSHSPLLVMKSTMSRQTDTSRSLFRKGSAKSRHRLSCRDIGSRGITRGIEE